MLYKLYVNGEKLNQIIEQAKTPDKSENVIHEMTL